VSEIVPRWEWRTFGDDLGAAEERLAALEPERVQDSDESYLLSRHSDASVKVRDGLMDVKRLEATNEDGLEQWRPVLKTEFTLSTQDLNVVLDALGLGADARAVDVGKHREHFTIDGCMTELSTITTDAGSVRTIAIELEDPAVVIATVRALGLEGRANTCLARGLKAMLGFQ
jgi:exopolyphosphatase/guanosine-5'-triphosphate,3'-diphosphate pyrophosphatase